MKESAPRVWVALLVVLGPWGCGSTDIGSVPPSPAESKEESPTMPPGHDRVPTDILGRILDEVSSASGVGRDELTIERAEAVTWNDGALGCPQPNVDYIQMIIQGYWVIVRAGQEDFDYRVDDRGRFRRCTGATRRAPIVYPPDS